MNERKYKNCCGQFALARESGSDAEGYGPLINDYYDDGLHAGCVQEPIRFCPWCAAPVQEDQERA